MKQTNRIFFIVLAILLPLLGGGSVFFLTRNVPAACIVLGLSALQVLFTAWQRHREQAYWRSVAAQLSDLCDCLLFLEHREIFPRNEDTVLSKFQDKVLKLVTILQQKNEDSRQAQENLKGLISDLSHQLKTPIASLKLYTALLEEPALTEQQRKQYTEVLRTAVDRLVFLSESMIQLSRLESGLIQLQPEEKSLNQTVLMAVKNVFVKAKQRHITLTYDSESDITLVHDQRWTAEAIFNLLDNAVKYAPSGSTVAIRVRELGLFAAVDVTDQADPIPESERSRIFQRFYRGQNSRNTEGIGIGLYLAREIAMKQNGHLNLRCGSVGNTFSLLLFQKKETNAEQRSDQEK